MPESSNASRCLEVKHITKTVKNRTLLNDVSLHLGLYESVGLLGPNGAGKTTCFSIIVGLIHQDFGDIFIHSQNVTHRPMDQRCHLGMGYLPQETSVFRGLTVEQNILAALEIALRDHDEREHRLDALIEEFSLGHLRHISSRALSGGERRRVEIARALAMSPSFLLLDEPLAGIDPIAVAEIREIITRLKTQGISILITDHNVRETFSMVDRAYILSNGKILAHGTPEEIVNHPEVRRVYLGEGFSF
jgi:lipopolysaccharide export system ATP-binding protein